MFITLALLWNFVIKFSMRQLILSMWSGKKNFGFHLSLYTEKLYDSTNFQTMS